MDRNQFGIGFVSFPEVHCLGWSYPSEECLPPFLQPLPVLRVVGVVPAYQLPELLGVVRVDEVAQLMDHHIIHDAGGASEDQLDGLSPTSSRSEGSMPLPCS